MNQPQVTPVVENIVMHEKTVRVSFSCMLASVPVYVTGYYFVNTNALYPEEINGQLIEDVCNEMHWDEYETTLAIQEAFENR
jgi:hypothetical protein